MKHLHLLMVVITLGLFLYHAIVVLMGKKVAVSRYLTIMTHISLLLLVVSGLYMLAVWYQFTAMWAIAKLILLIVAVSASMKAMRATATKAQAKFGMFIALIAYGAILVLAVKKPILLLF
ncbi:SirB2 family protein [Moraxella nasovis]|uniref:SirB2 family protein n=1 Tax=Moraxella nasovis TaxID=2904121 RepID=UPI001F617FBF|nr:SirB2 family protein [Moraxella nasovis]UNU73068.1 SirB2 family protein [Moraxella nasovis]